MRSSPPQYDVLSTPVDDRVRTALEVFVAEVVEPLGDPFFAGREGVEDCQTDLGGIGRINELSESTAEHGLASAVETAGDDGDAAGHRFEEDEPEAFAAARHHVGIGEIVEIRLL